MRSFFEAGKELLFPARCLGCDQQLPLGWQLPIFCPSCLDEISLIRSPLCPNCGLPLNSGLDHFCGDCLKKTFAFDLARAAVAYQGPITPLILSLKFGGQLTGLSTMAHLASASAGFADLSEPDLILPVPLHPQRLRERGFNQALVLGRSCFPARRKKIHAGLLIRKRATPPQTQLSGKERRKNLTQAFSITQPDMIRGKTILVIDDVFTTGSTVDECAKVLRRAGAKRIEVFTLARAIE